MRMRRWMRERDRYDHYENYYKDDYLDDHENEDYVYGYITFHENGNVKKGALAEAQTISGVKYNAKQWINFDENGKVVKSE